MSSRPPTENEENTPVTAPGVIRGRMPDMSNVPVASPDEDTGRHRAALLSDALSAQSRDPRDTAKLMIEVAERAAAHAISKGGGGGNGGNGGPPIDLKKLRKGNWIVNTIIAVVTAAAAGFGGYQVLQNTVASHDSEINVNKKAINENAEAIHDVNDSVEDLGEVIVKQTEAQDKIATSVGKLTSESKTRKETKMKNEIRDLKLKNAELIRARNRVRPQ